MSIVLALGSFLLECFFLYAYLTYDFPFFLFILVHLMLLFVLYKFAKKQHNLSSFLLIIAVFSAGPLGSAGFLLLSLLHPLFSLVMTPAHQWLKDLFPDPVQSSFTSIFQRVKAGWDAYEKPAESTSFQDLFTYGTLLQKQAVLDAIIKDFHPAFSPLLQQALQDPHNTVKIQAAAIISKIDFDFGEREIYLTRQLLLEPENLVRILQLAQHTDAYAMLQFLGESRRRALTEQALHLYKAYLKLSPGDLSIWFAQGRLLFYQKDYAGYETWCKAYKEKFKQLPTIAETWYQEALYHLHRYGDLADAIQRRA